MGHVRPDVTEKIRLALKVFVPKMMLLRFLFASLALQSCAVAFAPPLSSFPVNPRLKRSLVGPGLNRIW